MPEEFSQTESIDNNLSSGNDSLQSTMIGDFFDYDDGLGAVVNQDGDPFTKEDGKYYTSLDEYKNSLKNINTATVPQKPTIQDQKSNQFNANTKNFNQSKQINIKPDSFESFYKKENGFDVATLLNDAPKFNSFKYDREINPSLQEDSNNLQQQPQESIDPKVKDANFLKEYRENLESSALKPLERHFNNLVEFYKQQGDQLPSEVYESINSEYMQLKTAIDEAVDQKKEELFENRIKEERETNAFADVNRKSMENFSQISAQYFPNIPADQRETKLSKLIFGFQDSTGKFIRGYGADIVDHAFDLANHGKTFKSKDEWANAYNKWWSIYASNPANIAFVARAAWDRFRTSNEENIRDGYRSQWEQEQREKLKQSQQSPYATSGGNVSQVDNAQAQLNDYFKAPSRNM